MDEENRCTYTYFLCNDTAVRYLPSLWNYRPNFNVIEYSLFGNTQHKIPECSIGRAGQP
jgi:hypothetical protein